MTPTRAENRGTYASSSDYLVTSRYYDGPGRLTRTVGPDGEIQAHTYSGVGLLTRLTEDEATLARYTDRAYGNPGPIGVKQSGRLAFPSGHRAIRTLAHMVHYAARRERLST